MWNLIWIVLSTQPQQLPACAQDPYFAVKRWPDWGSRNLGASLVCSLTISPSINCLLCSIFPSSVNWGWSCNNSSPVGYWRIIWNKVPCKVLRKCYQHQQHDLGPDGQFWPSDLRVLSYALSINQSAMTSESSVMRAEHTIAFPRLWENHQETSHETYRADSASQPSWRTGELSNGSGLFVL